MPRTAATGYAAPAPNAPRGPRRWWIALVVVLVVAGILAGVGIWALHKLDRKSVV